MHRSNEQAREQLKVSAALEDKLACALLNLFAVVTKFDSDVERGHGCPPFLHVANKFLGQAG